MKVAAVQWQLEELATLSTPAALLDKIRATVQSVMAQGVNLVVFPGFTGLLYQALTHPQRSLAELVLLAESGEYLEQIKEISRTCSSRSSLQNQGRTDKQELEGRVLICPGSYWQRAAGNTYALASVWLEGEMILEQKQIYLARWEREIGLARGSEQSVYQMGEWKMGIVLGTDVFYPQVSRALALAGANLVLAPVGFIGARNQWLQISGMWKDVQQNQFFCVESGFNGRLREWAFWGESLIHAPVEMTPNEDGFLARIVEREVDHNFITAILVEEKRRAAIKQFDVLKQLHCELYRRMGLFEVRG